MMTVSNASVRQGSLETHVAQVPENVLWSKHYKTRSFNVKVGAGVRA